MGQKDTVLPEAHLGAYTALRTGSHLRVMRSVEEPTSVVFECGIEQPSNESADAALRRGGYQRDMGVWVDTLRPDGTHWTTARKMVGM